MNTYPPLDPEWVFPAGDQVTCGNRTDLFRKQRVHQFRDAGRDVRHQFGDGPYAGAYVECQVAICITCGKDIDEPVRESA